MGQRRGSANQVMVLGIALLCYMALTQPTFAAYYNVGGATGWTFNVNSWATTKPLKAGDILVFNYNKGLHNVVGVGKSGYNKCSFTKRAKVRQTGKDMFKLKKGLNYFICSIPGHCKTGGMKIAVKAT